MLEMSSKCLRRIKTHICVPRKRIWYNDTSFHNCYEEGCEIELLDIIRNTHKKSLAIEDGAERECCKYNPSIFVLGV